MSDELTIDDGATRDDVEEVRHLGSVRRPIPLEKEIFGLVRSDGIRRPKQCLRRPVIARLQHPLAAEHLEPLIVTIRGATDRIDLRKPAVARADRHRRRVDVASRLDRRIHQAASRCVHGGGLVFHDPAEHVEIVDQHVLVDAAGTLDVIDGGRAGIAARDDQHLRPSDVTPRDPRLD